MEYEEILVLFSFCRQEWKEVIISDLPLPPSMVLPMRHYPTTLERLKIVGDYGFLDHDKVQILALCPKLREFIITPGISARTFIDQDLHTGALKPWACESSLKHLRVMIAGIPKPDLREEGVRLGLFRLPEYVVKESYPGQGRDIQEQVYDRLARLTNLETLGIAGTPSGKSIRTGLEMSLASGLHKLSGLTTLKRLNVSNRIMAKIGVQEVQWMTKHWPELCEITHLFSKETKEWLQQHHPEILLK